MACGLQITLHYASPREWGLSMKYSAKTLSAGMIAIAATGFSMTSAAHGQAAQFSGQFEVPYGMGLGLAETPYDPTTRDSAGNRLVIDGRIINSSTYSTLGTGMNTPWGATSGSGMLGYNMAIGNQLNVITNGNNNTIIIDSTQINNGNQTAILNGEQANNE